MAKETSRILETYFDTLFGIPVVIHGAVIEAVDEKGETWIAIPDEQALGCAIAMARSVHPVRLQPDDIRMMRKTLHLRQGAFAKLLGISQARLSRLEKSTQGLGHYTEMQIRLFVAARLAKQAPAIVCDFEALATLSTDELRESAEPVVLHFERVTLKSAETGAKSREWDLAEAPEAAEAVAAARAAA